MWHSYQSSWSTWYLLVDFRMNPTSSHRILLSYIFHLQSTSRLTMSSTSMNRQQTGRCLWHSSPCKSVRIVREQLHPNTSGWQFEAMQNRHLIHGIHGQAVRLWRLCSKMNRTWYWISINIGRWSSPNDWSYDRSLELWIVSEYWQMNCIRAMRTFPCTLQFYFV